MLLDRKRTALCGLGGLTLGVVCGIALVALLNAAFSVGESIWPGPAPQPGQSANGIFIGTEPIYSDGDGNIVEIPIMCAWYGSPCCLRNPGARGCGRQVPTVAPTATPAPEPTREPTREPSNAELMSDFWSGLAEPAIFCQSRRGVEDCCVECAGMFCGQDHMTALLEQECNEPTPTPAPEPTTDTSLIELLDAVDFTWGMCLGDCSVSAEAFEAFMQEQCEGGE